jgi:putative hydrolase of the HAD superfamily
MSIRRLWAIFDGDDTIFGVLLNGEAVGTAKAYQDTNRRFEARMEREGIDPELARKTKLEIDMQAAGELGFGSRARYPTSLRKTYEMLCPNPNAIVARQIEDIGWSVFTDYPYVALPGALKTLETLSKEFNIAIVTKGEDQEQRKKAYDSGVFVYADQVITMTTKSFEEWEEKVITPLRITPMIAKHSWAIGNSVKSDVNPPLLHGFNGLLLAADETWAFERAEVVPAHPERTFLHINAIEETVPILMPHLMRTDT